MIEVRKAGDRSNKVLGGLGGSGTRSVCGQIYMIYSIQLNSFLKVY